MLPTPDALEGKPVPQVTFKARPHNQWRDLTTDELFKGKTVVAFSLPGAYTPTCSSAHLPRYNELAPVFKENGVDAILCLSVNDAFVMNEWQAGQDAANIQFIPDGNGDFSRGMGMLVDKRELGFGERSWRYSMLVKDGIIQKIFIEPDKEGDPFEVSDAETMLRYLNPQVRIPEPVLIFAKPGCPFCARAKELLQQHQLAYTEVTQSQAFTSSALRAVSGASTWPQVFVGGKKIGGAEELESWLQARSQQAA